MDFSKSSTIGSFLAKTAKPSPKIIKIMNYSLIHGRCDMFRFSHMVFCVKFGVTNLMIGFEEIKNFRRKNRKTK